MCYTVLKSSPLQLKCVCPLVLSQILWLSSITPRRLRNIDCQIKKNTCGHILYRVLFFNLSDDTAARPGSSMASCEAVVLSSQSEVIRPFRGQRSGQLAALSSHLHERRWLCRWRLCLHWAWPDGPQSSQRQSHHHWRRYCQGRQHVYPLRRDVYKILNGSQPTTSAPGAPWFMAAGL